MQIKPGSVSHLLLLALRAGEMERCELDERVPSNSKPLCSLLRAGFISNSGSAYSITPAGREACPLRREIKSEITENAYYFDKKKPSASSIHSSVSSRRSSVPSWPREKQPDGSINDVDPVDIHQPSSGRVNAPQQTQQIVADMAASANQQLEESMQTQKTPRSVLAMQYLIKVGKATGKEIKQAVHEPGEEMGTGGVTSYLITYIKLGWVTVQNMGRPKSAGFIYQVKPGITLEDLPRQKYGRAGKAAPGLAQNCAEKSTDEFQPNEPVGKVFKFPEHSAQVSNTDKTASDKVKTVLSADPERQYSAHQVFIDATGQLVIQHPGVVRMVFPAEDTRRIQKLFLAIDLDSLCA